MDFGQTCWEPSPEVTRTGLFPCFQPILQPCFTAGSSRGAEPGLCWLCHQVLPQGHPAGAALGAPCPGHSLQFPQPQRQMLQDCAQLWGDLLRLHRLHFWGKSQDSWFSQGKYPALSRLLVLDNQDRRPQLLCSLLWKG